MMDKPDRFSDPKGYVVWELSQLTNQELAILRRDAVSRIAYLDKNHAVQRANRLNPPSVQDKLELRNRAPHEFRISTIDRILAERSA